MSVQLSKGQNTSLTKERPALTKIVVGLGWSTPAGSSDKMDLDASCFLLTATGKVRTEADFIFYNNLTSPDGAVTHTGDNRTGDGDGDDEQVIVDLSALPPAIERLAFVVTIHEANTRGQNFGQMSDAYMRILDANDETEIANFDLDEDYGGETAVLFGEVYRNGGEWKFKAVGRGAAGGLTSFATDYGVNLG